jgi:hypothetical protein
LITGIKFRVKCIMLNFDKSLALQAIKTFNLNNDELFLEESFVKICEFISEFDDAISSIKSKPSVHDLSGLTILAEMHVKGYRKKNIPTDSSTVPDEMVSVILKIIYDYSDQELETIKVEHKRSMTVENCVGALLERYINSKLKQHNWHWCCGNFVQAIDFISQREDWKWDTLQVKNRKTTENSSSKKVRDETEIKHDIFIHDLLYLHLTNRFNR